MYIEGSVIFTSGANAFVIWIKVNVAQQEDTIEYVFLQVQLREFMKRISGYDSTW